MPGSEANYLTSFSYCPHLLYMDFIAMFTIETGGQKIMLGGYCPISRQHDDVMPFSSHNKTML